MMYTKYAKYIVAVFYAVAWAATGPSIALAGCNDLIVNIETEAPWRFVRPGDDDCTFGDVEEFNEQHLLITGDSLAGPQCNLTLLGESGQRSRVEVDQNLCVAEGGTIQVRHRSGPKVPFLSREGSAGNGRAGLITFGANSGDPGSPPGQEGKIHVVTYNVFDRPYVAIQDGQDARMQRLPALLRGLNGGRIDAVVFQEAFNGDVLRDGLRRIGMTEQTPTIIDPAPTITDPASASLQNGGVFIASRWQITNTDSHVYRACSGNDCLAAKGVVYARIKKKTAGGGLVFHVFGTHLQAGGSAEAAAIRLQQTRQLQEFISSKNLPTNEPVLIAGDFNVDAAHHGGRVRMLAKALDAELPVIPKGVFTSDPTTNELVGLDGAASDGGCCDSYTRGQSKTCQCCPKEFLDLVFYSKSHRPPSSNLELKMAPVHSSHFAACILPYNCSGLLDGCQPWRLRNVSDHYPVFTTYHF